MTSIWLNTKLDFHKSTGTSSSGGTHSGINQCHHELSADWRQGLGDLATTTTVRGSSIADGGATFVVSRTFFPALNQIDSRVRTQKSLHVLLLTPAAELLLLSHPAAPGSNSPAN